MHFLLIILILAVIGLGGGRVWAAQNYNSAKSNTVTSIYKVNEEVGNILLRYYIGGAEINEVTDALAVGISEEKLITLLTEVGLNAVDVKTVLADFDKLGIASEGAAGSATPVPSAISPDAPVKESTESATPSAVDQPGAGQIEKEVSAPDATGATPSAGDPIDGIDISLDEIERAEPAPAVTTPTSRTTSIYKTVELTQIAIGKIQERLKACYNLKVCDIVERHAKDRLGLTDTTKKAIENRNWEEATRLLREVRSIVVGDIKLLEGAEDGGLITDVLRLERALLNQTDLALKEMSALKPAPATTPLFNPAEYTKSINELRDSTMKSIQNLKTAESEEQREEIRKELQINRETFKTEILSMDLRSIRENAKELRDNFRENVKATIGHVDHGKTARIALAHGKGLRMVNRYRSAIARFDHILGRLESRIEKIGIEIEGEARANTGKVKDTFPPDNLVILIETAKNTQALNKAKLAELEAKYESLLLGKNPGGVAKEARVIAEELKAEIEKLHTLLVIGPILILDIPDDFPPPYTQNIDTFGRSGQDLTKKTAQSFELASQQTIKQIKIKVRENQSPTDGIAVSLQTDTNDRPSGVTLSSALKSRQQLLSSGLDDSSFTQITFNLNNAASLSPNTKYWIVVARENEDPFDNNNYYELRNYADVYSDGGQSNYRTCDGTGVWVPAGLACADVDSGGVIGGGTIGIGGVDLPGGGVVVGGGQVTAGFDIDLELWKTINPIKYMKPVR